MSNSVTEKRQGMHVVYKAENYEMVSAYLSCSHFHIVLCAHNFAPQMDEK